MIVLNNKGISIVVASAKGGVGKTITTLNLAGIFEVLQKKVLIIDFDLSGGGISAALNIPNGKSSYHFAYDYNNNQYQEFKNYITKYQISISSFTKTINSVFAIRELRISIDMNTFIQLKVRILPASLIPEWICIKLYSIYN